MVATICDRSAKSGHALRLNRPHNSLMVVEIDKRRASPRAEASRQEPDGRFRFACQIPIGRLSFLIRQVTFRKLFSVVGPLDERLEASGILRTKRDPGEGRKLKEAVYRECAKIRQGPSNEDQLAADEQSAEQHVSLRSVAPGPVGMDDQQIA